MPTFSGRRVTVVLCSPAGDLLGALPPIDLDVPWFTGVVDLVDAVRDAYGLGVTILRLLDADRPPGPDGGAHLVHLAQLDAPATVPDGVPLGPVPPLPAPSLAEHAVRLSYARPGGPGDDLAWADRALAARGTPRTGPPRQMRTWNLSCIWRIPTSAGPVWLKVVPPFFGHEGAMLALVGEVTDAVPPLLARERGRVLLGDVAGHDLYRATTSMLRRMPPLLVGAQAALAGRVGEMLSAGAFDWRPASFEPLAEDVVDRTAGEVDAATRAALRGLLRGLPARHAAIAACGLPDTLVHGDFHPGNIRGPLAQDADGAAGDGAAGDGAAGDGAVAAVRDEPLVILDWGDAGVGNPLLDQAAFLEWTPEADRPRIVADWSSLWRAAVPGCDPDRAAALLAPVAALRQAVIYRLFLDRIEPSEQIYHAGDPPLWLAKAAEVAGP